MAHPPGKSMVYSCMLKSMKLSVIILLFTYRDDGLDGNTSKLRIEEGEQGHAYQTLHLDELDYESMYTRTIPKKQTQHSASE